MKKRTKLKNRTKIMLISVAASLVVLPVVVLHLMLWLSSYLSVWSGMLSHMELWHASDNLATFGESNHPAIAALGRMLESHPELVTGDEFDWSPTDHRKIWSLPHPDRSVWLGGYTDLVDRESQGFYYTWELQFDFKSFFAAGLNEDRWRLGKPSFAIGRGEQDNKPYLTVIHRDSIFDLYRSPPSYLDEKTFLEKGAAADFASALSFVADDITEPAPGRYRLDLSNAALEWDEESGTISFILNAKPLKKGGLRPKKLIGWEYDKKADTLTKRITM